MDTLKYHLSENQLTPDPDDYMSIAEPAGSYTDGDFVTEMLKHGTLSSRSNILATMNLEKHVIGDLVKQSKPLKLSLFNGSPSISGVFDGPYDLFDSNCDYVKYNLSPGLVIPVRPCFKGACVGALKA